MPYAYSKARVEPRISSRGRATAALHHLSCSTFPRLAPAAAPPPGAWTARTARGRRASGRRGRERRSPKRGRKCVKSNSASPSLQTPRQTQRSCRSHDPARKTQNQELKNQLSELSAQMDSLKILMEENFRRQLLFKINCNKHQPQPLNLQS